MWANSAGEEHSPPTDIVSKQILKWGTGRETTTKLFTSKGEVSDADFSVIDPNVQPKLAVFFIACMYVCILDVSCSLLVHMYVRNFTYVFCMSFRHVFWTCLLDVSCLIARTYICMSDISCTYICMSF